MGDHRGSRTARKKTNHEIVQAVAAIGTIVDSLQESGLRLLPTENELMETLSFGRYTIRQAVQSFVDRGVLERIQGKGTFILDARTEVSFSGWIGTEPPGDIAVDELMRSFHADQHRLSISYKPIPYYQTTERLLNLALRGMAPDVMQLTPPIFATLSNLGLLLPLDQHVNHSSLKRQYPVDVESGRIGRTLFSVTWGLSPLILYYNRNVLSRAGMNPDHPPGTLDEMFDMCVRINSASEHSAWGISLPLSVNDPTFLWLYPYLRSFNGGFVDGRTGNIIIDSGENARALEWLGNLYRRGGSPGVKDITEGRMLFASDRIGFWLDGPWLRGLFRQMSGFRRDFDSHYGVAKIPVGPSGKSESILWNHSLGISADCRHVESASKWIEFLTSNEESARSLFRTLGTLPPVRDFLHTPFFSEEPFSAVCIDQMDTVSSFPVGHPLFIKSIPFISQVLSDTITENLAPAERLAFLKEIVEIINRNKFLSIFSH
jgi:multiple sugar transport system substrate-binding protein